MSFGDKKGTKAHKSSRGGFSATTLNALVSLLLLVACGSEPSGPENPGERDGGTSDGDGGAPVRDVAESDSSPGPACGNLACDEGETCSSCAGDCGACPIVQYVESAHPLEILQPQAGLDDTNRFYRAYPGLLYNVSVAVVGGAFPYRYELLSAPEGMNLDPATGDIAFVPEEEGVFEVSLRVVDSAGTQTQVEWSTTVARERFLFIDAVAGSHSGSGTVDDPMRSLADFFGSTKADSTYDDYFLYFREGVYDTEDVFLEDGRRVPMPPHKPHVWLAYPGEEPVLELWYSTVVFYGGQDHVYIEGFDIDVTPRPEGHNDMGRAFRIDSNASHVSFRRNRCHGLRGGVGNNSACLMIVHARRGSFWNISDNEFFEIDTGFGVLGYMADRVLVSRNFVHDFTGPGHGIGPKVATSRWFIRENRIDNMEGNGIWANYREFENIFEISHNLITNAARAIYINQSSVETGPPCHVYRNTLVGSVRVRQAGADNGPFRFESNVLINDDGEGGVECLDCNAERRLEDVDNLVGTPADEIVDPEGQLQGDYAEQTGSVGHAL